MKQCFGFVYANYYATKNVRGKTTQSAKRGTSNFVGCGWMVGGWSRASVLR